MIVQERFEINGHDFIRTYSDAGRYVVREEIAYFDACDPAEYGRTYTEGDLMPQDEESAVDILNIIMGEGTE